MSRSIKKVSEIYSARLDKRILNNRKISNFNDKNKKSIVLFKLELLNH